MLCNIIKLYIYKTNRIVYIYISLGLKSLQNIHKKKL